MWAQLQRFTSVFPLFCLRDFLREQQQQGYLQGRKKWLNVYCNYMFTIDAWYFTSRCLTLLFCFKILLQMTVHFLKTVSWWHLRERTTSPVLKEGIGSIQLYMSLIQLPLNWIIVLTSCYIMYFVKLKWTDQDDTSVGQRKIWVPDKNRTYTLPNTGRAFYPLRYENSRRARSFNWVHVWQASCILPRSAPSKSSRVWKKNKMNKDEVICSIPVGDSDFLLVPRSCLVCWQPVFSLRVTRTSV